MFKLNMMNDSLHVDQLDLLQFDDQLKLLDDIDKLRSQEISHYVSLSQLIVCDDQSFGKSFVLKAIFEISFLIKDNLCTRFATKVILRKISIIIVSVAIVLNQTRSKSDRHWILSFQETLTDFKKFSSLIETAKTLMSVFMTESAFFNDVLRVEISESDRSHLTIVNLSGLIHSENKAQSAANVKLVLKMVRCYMENRRSINLAIVFVKNDYANQIVLKMTRDVDSIELRTLRMIIKPDTLSVDLKSEIDFINLTRNKDIEFRLEWHVLRNRDYETKDYTKKARDLAERQFFSQNVWKDFSRRSVEIITLRDRLSTVLLEQIRIELSSLVDDIQVSIENCEIQLNRLEDSRAIVEKQRLFLLRISQAFQSLSRAAIDNIYDDSFFEDSRSIEDYCKRLRAVVQNLNLNFAKSMRVKDHHRFIVETIFPEGSSSAMLLDAFNRSSTFELVERSDFISEIRDLLKKSRERELSGMFSSLIIDDLFCEQFKSWKVLARQHLHDTWNATRAFLKLTASHLTNDVTSEALLREIVDSLMNEKLRRLDQKLDELLEPHRRDHSITYNHYFTETIQNVRQKRLEKEIARRLNTFLDQKKNATTKQINVKNVKTSNLISTLSSRNEVDMNRYACFEILDCMKAYYKIIALF